MFFDKVVMNHRFIKAKLKFIEEMVDQNKLSFGCQFYNTRKRLKAKMNETFLLKAPPIVSRFSKQKISR